MTSVLPLPHNPATSFAIRKYQANSPSASSLYASRINCTSTIVTFLFVNPHMGYFFPLLFRESETGGRGAGGGVDIDVRETHPLVGSCMESEPQPRYRPRTEIEPATLTVHGVALQWTWATPARASLLFFQAKKMICLGCSKTHQTVCDGGK